MPEQLFSCPGLGLPAHLVGVRHARQAQLLCFEVCGRVPGRREEADDQMT